MMFRLVRGAIGFCPWLLLLVASAASACSGRVHVEIKDSGVYALDYAAIVAAQPELKDCRADEFALSNHGNEVPIRIVGAGHGQFGPGASIQWLGRRLHGPESWFDPYSNVNVYLLSATPGKHARLRDVVARPRVSKFAPLRRSVHFEQENLMIRLGIKQMKHGEEPDVWQWAKLTPIDPKPFAHGFDLPDLDTSARGQSGAIKITLDFRGISRMLVRPGSKEKKPVDHVILVTLNGRPLKSIRFDGLDEIRRTLDVPRGRLKPAGNRIELRVPRRTSPRDAKNFIVDVVMFNWMQVDYPARGDVSVDHHAFSAMTRAPVELDCPKCRDLALFGSDGSYRPAAKNAGGRFRAGGGSHHAKLFPLIDGRARKPDRVRAVTSRNLRQGDPGFDYLIVAHPRLLDAIKPLAAYHRAHGYRVALYNVDNVYDEFNGGIAHPVAIRRLVAWGYKHWQVKPRYLLLVGDASVDIHHDIRDKHRLTAKSFAPSAEPMPRAMLTHNGFIGMGTIAYSHWDPTLANRNLIPTWQVPSSSHGQSASDNGFVTLKPGDFHPQLAVGRLPVVEPAAVTAIVDKTIQYLSNPKPGPWHRDVTFISTSEVASFKKESDKIAAELGQRGYVVNNIYSNFNEKSKKHYHQVRKLLRQDLDAGNLLVHYIGHGGQYVWRVGPMGDLFNLDDVSALTNAGRYPMVLAMTCFTAPFDNPTDDSVGERFLREANRGAIAVFAASWSNSPNPKHSKELINGLLKPNTTIGDAIVEVKKRSKDRIFVEMYNLLGDPAVVLARPHGELRFALSENRWNRRLIVRVPGGDFGGNVDVDWVGANGKVKDSRRYQARNNQFFLPLKGNNELRVYTTDTRNGVSAFGNFDPDGLARSSSKHKHQDVASAPRKAATAGSRHVPGTQRKPTSGDRISKQSFDSAGVLPRLKHSLVHVAKTGQ